MSITLVLADDHPVLLNGLANLFEIEGDMEVLAKCTTAVEALEAVRLYRPELAVLDIRMPKMTGLELARQMKEEKLPTRIVLLTAMIDEDQTIEALRLGVHGLLLKELAPHLIVECIRKVHAGEQWVEHASAMLALEAMLRRERAAREFGALLTERELEIVFKLARGLSNKAIAEDLCVSEGTVKVHLHNIYDKVKVHDRTALLRHAQEKGLV